uniref:non-specific serine/threonine protein kinase n=1 Tax=Triticum aestivum TaxID=4565 RepID=A0A077RTJ6_WHEAT|nr:unnamed protein product [Triticum aestivum]
MYTMKVVDRRAVAKKHKLERAAAEKRILRLLDHPFLPTLFADFEAAPRFSCVVMEFCPGGDLHSLRHRIALPPLPALLRPVLRGRDGYQNGKFSTFTNIQKRILRLLDHPFLPTLFADFEAAPRFSCVVMEFCPGGDLHSLRHRIALPPLPALLRPVLRGRGAPGARVPAHDRHRLPRPQASRRRGGGTGGAAQRVLLPDTFQAAEASSPVRASPPRLVAEPVSARSCSFVGTHEYVAPEVAGGGAHGAAVDWWAYGLFLYELLHGRSAFAGATNGTRSATSSARRSPSPPPLSPATTPTPPRRGTSSRACSPRTPPPASGPATAPPT